MSGYVLDDTVLAALGQGDNDVANVIAALDSRSVRMAVPAGALIIAESTLSDEQCDLVNAVVARVDQVALDELADLNMMSVVARLVGWIGKPDDVAAAHTAMLAKRLDWSVLTVDPSRWIAAQEALPWRVPVIELSDD